MALAFGPRVSTTIHKIRGNSQLKKNIAKQTLRQRETKKTKFRTKRDKKDKV